MRVAPEQEILRAEWGPDRRYVAFATEDSGKPRGIVDICAAQRGGESAGPERPPTTTAGAG